MNLVNKNFIIFFLIVCVVGVFVFHWFFIQNMMPASECFSINCAYSSPQAMTQRENNILIFVIAVFFAVALMSLKFNGNEFNGVRELSGRFALKKFADVFFYKLISWLKTLEKRDPQTASIAARISDFIQ